MPTLDIYAPDYTCEEREGASVLFTYTMGVSVADGDLPLVLTLDRLDNALTLGSIGFYYDLDKPDPDYLDPRLVPDVLVFPGDPSFADVALAAYRWWAGIWAAYQNDLALAGAEADAEVQA